MKKCFDESKLVITINNEHPVELVDLAQSMLALASEYRQVLDLHEGRRKAEDVKLYVKEVRSGSIIQELVPYAITALPFVSHCNTIVDFATHISKLSDWFLNHRTLPNAADLPVNRKTIQNIDALLEPIAKDPGSTMSMGVSTVNGDINLTVNISSHEAGAIQNNLAHALRDMKKSVAGEYKNVVMYWSQARNDRQGSSGDLAVIERISRAAVKVVFSSDNLKKRMLFDIAHPFEKAFLVDVFVETIEGKPVLYVVHELHELIDRD